MSLPSCRSGLFFFLSVQCVVLMCRFGEVIDINMPRDKETGKPKGFGFLMYEDQRSTVLAVDNMNGAQVLGRTIRVDHCKKYEQRGTKNAEGDYVAPEEPTYNAMPPTLEGSSCDFHTCRTVGADPCCRFIGRRLVRIRGGRLGRGRSHGGVSASTEENAKDNRWEETQT